MRYSSSTRLLLTMTVGLAFLLCAESTRADDQLFESIVRPALIDHCFSRLIAEGVRVVEIIDSGASDNWDSHGDMQHHRPKAQRVDRSLAGLIADLQHTGLWDDTLVVICTEFGRTPFDPGPGRNHWHRAFTSLLCGAGVRGGLAYGASDEYGIDVAENPVHVHDYHATILHLMGIDHQRLTYRYAGRDFRLTDVAGNVVKEILI